MTGALLGEGDLQTHKHSKRRNGHVKTEGEIDMIQLQPKKSQDDQ